MSAPFSAIVGQPRAVEALRHALAGDRLCPSLIFHGPPGVGKLPTALALARALLCPAAVPPCDGCAACRRIDERALLHPDLRVVFPERLSDFEKGQTPDEGSGGIDLQESQAEAIANPAWTVLIDRIRQGIGFLQRHPAEGRRSILIVDQAHRMPAEAANALLKTLEEPPAHAVLILMTPSYHALLPTLRSRARAITFQLVPRAELEAYLVRRLAIPQEEASLRAGIASGRIGVAIDLDLAEFRRRRDALLQVLETLLRQGDAGIAVARAEEIARGGEAVEGDLEILISLLRDLMLAGALPGGRALIHVDCAGRLAALAHHLGADGPRAVDELERAIAAIRRKGNRQLLLENVLLDLVPGAAPPAPAGPA